MARPFLAVRESATTMRYWGAWTLPKLFNLILTATCGCSPDVWWTDSLQRGVPRLADSWTVAGEVRGPRLRREPRKCARSPHATHPRGQSPQQTKRFPRIPGDSRSLGPIPGEVKRFPRNPGETSEGVRTGAS